MKSKNILITGISSGFGLMATLELLKKGHRVIGVVRGGSHRLEGQIPEAIRSGQLICIDADLAQPESLSQISDAVLRHFDGELDVLIHNAGFGIFAPGHMLSETELRHQLEVNFIAPVLLTQKLISFLVKRKGRILCLSSVCGRIGLPFYSNYCASKFAMEGFFESLWMDLRKEGVQVCLIEPGGFKTEFNKKLLFGAQDFPEKAALKELIQTKTRSVGQPPEKVVQTLVRLCTQTRIPLRVSQGLDAKILLFAQWLLPNQWFASLIYKAFRWTLSRSGGS